MKRDLVAPGVVRGEHWHLIEDGRRVACDLCPRECKLQEGQRGFCYVRQARDGGIDLTSYGVASGFCIDPIEKKPLNHFHPGTSVLSFGTAGCNLGCRFCQNWDISKAREQARLNAPASPEDIARAAQQAGAKSVAFTYNDPVIFAEYAVDTAYAAHELGIYAVAVTAGYISPGARERFFAPMDAANVDLKAFSERFYEKLCFAKLGPVLDTLRWIRRETKLWLEVTTLLIPGHNDTEAEVEQLVQFVAEELGPETPLHFTAYHPDFKLDAPHTPAETLLRAHKQAQAGGLRHVYLGNLRLPVGQDTLCPGCGETVISRDIYDVRRYRLTERGACPVCSYQLQGRFGAAAGSFGRRRIPITIASRAP
jgi:pyruvate formate lyase activating enzyme